MPKIMFVCHGNICRSPMAEYVLKYLVAQQGKKKDFTISSAATSTEEIGNQIHHGTKQKLNDVGIPTDKRCAVQLQKADYQNYDYIIGMDSCDIKDMMRILGGDPENKVCRLLDFTEMPRDIADPWYTGNFDVTYTDIVEGCTSLLKQIR